MEQCFQFNEQSVFQHGESVWNYTKNIIAGDFTNLQLPEWFLQNHSFIINNLHNFNIIQQYNVFHDCGKPFCIEYGIDGKKHFPHHAEVSEKIAKDLFCEDVCKLIGLDMLLHTSTVEQIKAINLDIKIAFTLIITSFAELHSNASMFGGTDSVNFKIKYKKLQKNAKTLFEQFKQEDEHVYSYVIVRNDLTPSQKAVQGGHAIAEFYKRNPEYPHYSVIYLVVKDEKKLIKVGRELLDNNITFTNFREPDFGNTLTALCTEPLNEEKRQILKRYMLLQN